MEATSLIRKGLFRAALHDVRRTAGAQTSARLLEAQLLQLTGRNVEAHANAQRLVRRLRGAVEKAQAFELLGAISIDFGQIEEARRHLTNALQIAAGAKDPSFTARIHLRLIPTLSDLDGQALATALGEARRSVARCGDRHLLALLHLRFGQVEAKRGLLDRAREHLDSGWRLLADEPNVWIDGLLCLDASSVCAMLGDTAEAIRFAQGALARSDESGHLRTEVAALSNLCAFALRQGRVEEASALARQGLSKASGFERLRIALLDNYVELALLRDDIATAERTMLEVESAIRTPGGSPSSWLRLSAYLTRIRLLSRRNDWLGTLHASRAAVDLADERGDRVMSVLFRARGTEALIRLGKKVEAQDLLLQAISRGEGASLTVLGELERVQGLFCAECGDQVGAADHLNRAARVVASAGNALMKREVDSALCGRGNVASVHLGPSPIPAPALPRLDPRTLEAIAHLLGLVGKPEALSREVLDLIAGLNAASGTSVSSQPSTVQSTGDVSGRAGRGANVDLVEIDTGGPPLQTPPVVAKLRRNVSIDAPIFALKRIVETGVRLTRLIERESVRASLWPPEVDLDGNMPLLASASLRDAMTLARQAAMSSAPVLLIGETGVGKEVVAREIHRCSPFSAGPFVPFNCTAIPHEMFDAQLFGHRRGAFTGAIESSPGVIRAAEGGSLFLDEIGDLAPVTQPKLLRFLDSGEVHPVGESRPSVVATRVIAATNANLSQLIAEGRFRVDLYYRLGVFQIAIPPLRERREEIPSLSRHFVERYSRELKRPVPDISDEALEYLLLYSWPGNVRELSAEMQRSVILGAAASVLTPEVLSERIRVMRSSSSEAGVSLGSHVAAVSVDQPLSLATEDLERFAIRRALLICEGNLERAASLLGISRKGLLLKRRRLGFTVLDRLPPR